MRHFPVLVPTSVGPVPAIVTEADVPAHGAVAILHGAGGWRSGPNQLWAKTAADLAEGGMTVLRMDYLLGPNGQSRDLTQSVKEALAWFADRLEGPEITLVGVCLGARVAVSVADNEPRVGGLVLVNPYFGELRVKTRLARLRRVGKRVPGIGRVARKVARPLTSEMDQRYQGSVDAGARYMLEALLERMPVHAIVGERDRSLVMVRQLQAELPNASGFSVDVGAGASFNPMNSLAAQQAARRMVVSVALRRDAPAVHRNQPGWTLQR
jgi:pimeloyl-ACP methyl ester carboxylesterase